MPRSLRPSLLFPSFPSLHGLDLWLTHSLGFFHWPCRLENPFPSPEPEVPLLMFALCWETYLRWSALQQTQLRDGCKVKEEPVHRVPRGIQIPGNLSDIQVMQMAVPALALQPAYSFFPLWLVCLFLYSTGSTWVFLFGWLVVGFFCGCCFFKRASGNTYPRSHGRTPCPLLTKPESLTWPRVFPVTCPVVPNSDVRYNGMYFNGSSAAAQLLESKDISQTTLLTQLPA